MAKLRQAASKVCCQNVFIRNKILRVVVIYGKAAWNDNVDHEDMLKSKGLE